MSKVIISDKLQKASNKELADYLEVSLSAVKQYRPKKKKDLMLYGLQVLKEFEEKQKKNR